MEIEKEANLLVVLCGDQSAQLQWIIAEALKRSGRRKKQP